MRKLRWRWSCFGGYSQGGVRWVFMADPGVQLMKGPHVFEPKMSRPKAAAQASVLSELNTSAHSVIQQMADLFFLSFCI